MSVIVGGCSNGGPPLTIHPASGKVLLADGKPLSGGTIYFEPVNAPAMTAKGEIQADGTFSLTTQKAGDGAVVGENLVFIQPASATGKPQFPQEFTDAESSGIRITIKSGPNQLEPIVLKKAARRGGRAR